MYKLLRITLFALPLAGGAAWAQGSGTSGSAGAPGTATPPSVTDDTRTPLQQKAGRIDDTTPTLPGDATKPVDVPKTVPESNSTGLPDSAAMPDKSAPAPDKKAPADDTTKTQNKSDSDLTKDQLNSDK
jgi:hypothetical protein